ncbi:hypothetical protein BDK51DRAFT_39091 [Blyttiomyces helicus]|uniref:Non-homologous end-joining factor 1 n=1 Tax=Blyttiomyces helicus TaxID=388810 RepID=A0A4P9W7E6_9FUNG|nr:hypothetical protein BDK51DRAFT_39091 [Blyttiomyces helicus]|eukprot:RKO88002.1 hypothetical protein BDK51DRAFT_39091 [Blyttiomyces helicus]
MTPDALVCLPWTSYRLPTPDPAAQLALYAKSHFTSDSYALLVTDLRRMWFEFVSVKSVPSLKAKTEETAAAFLDSGTGLLISVAKLLSADGALEARVYDEQWLTPHLRPRKLHIHAKGKIGKLPFKWIFKCKQVKDECDVVYTHLTLPLLMMTKERARREEGVAERLERDGASLGTAARPRRSAPFEYAAYSNEADTEFKRRSEQVADVADGALCDPRQMHLYELATGKIVGPVDGSDAGRPTAIAAPYGDTLVNAPTLPGIAFGHTGYFKTETLTVDQSASQKEKSLSKKEMDRAMEQARKVDRARRLAELEAAKSVPKKRSIL